ncbi:hypothetical protein [Mariniflexile sp.]|uniref:hypothetical protein n=1 Tax=Mariniflexile sp. TaxID=1979402 RepID=UPI004048B2C2
MTSSCSKNDDNQDSKFQGTWTGTYTGAQDNGSWTANIDTNGKVTGTTSSTVYNNSLQLNGNISSSGEFIATAGSASNGAEFNGQMTTTSVTGTWSNTTAGINGTWSGNKQ